MIEVFPPIEESIIANVEVGMLIYLIPLLYEEETKPTKSNEEILLEEIRDLLKEKKKTTKNK